MGTFSLLVISFLIQEPVTTGATILYAYQSGFNVWIIHLLFVLCTIIDIFIGYYVGVRVHKKYLDNRIVKYAKRKAEALEHYTGKHGYKLALIVFGQMIFPISAFITPWIGVTFKESFIYLLIGEVVLWYGLEWLLILGIKTFVPDPQIALYGLIVIALLIIAVVRRWERRKVN